MNPAGLLVGIFLFALLFAVVQVGAVSIAFDKLGLSAHSAMLLLLTSLAGSAVNLPLFTLNAEAPPAEYWRRRPHWSTPLLTLRPDKVLVALNVGGGLVPVAFSAYLLSRHPVSLGTATVAVAMQSAVCYLASRPIQGVGIGMPIFIAPLSAALIAVILRPEQSAPLAYICGTVGVLVGADLLRLPDVRRLGSPLASIGGAGTFDGIFISGIVAVLLA